HHRSRQGARVADDRRRRTSGTVAAAATGSRRRGHSCHDIQEETEIQRLGALFER
ncbi:hypothetical protein Dimus_003069, partial [Dionaea muscipula]